MPMTPLSIRARESIKTGLAMAVTIALALRLALLAPSWAGFAVAMISLDSAGQALNKAALRMLGTLVAFVASLSFVGLFPQERWGMMLALTPYIGLCTYMLAGKKRQYFWYVCAFVCLTIMIHGGIDSENIFRYAVARVEETALGILVYSLTSVFLWPRSSRGDLGTARDALFDTQLQLYRAYRGLMAGQGREEDSRPLRLQAAQRLSQLEQVLNGAVTDCYEVWESRHAWRLFVQQLTVLREVLGRWRVSLPEIRALDLARILPSAEASMEEMQRRLVQIQRMLAGSEAEAPPRTVELAVVQGEIAALSHFQKAALAQLRTQLRELDEVTRVLFDSAREIEGSGRITTKPLREDARPPRLAFDPDRLRSVATVLATMWIGFLLWIYVDPPGHASFWYNGTLWMMISVLSRQSVASMVPGFLLGIGVGGVAYVGVMPHLSSYAELGLLFFCATAGGFYLLWEPRRRGTRSMYVAMFLVVTSVENQQTYSFASYANTATSILLQIALAAIVAYFPSSPRPEKVFLRLLARLFRHAELLMSRLGPEGDRGSGFAVRWKSAWYRNDLLELPVKLVDLAERIDYRLLPGTTPEQIRALVTNLLSLTLRVKELLDAREQSQPDPRLEQVLADLRDWRLVAERQFRLWATDPSASSDSVAEMSDRLHARLARLEDHIEEARTRFGEGGFHADYEKLYRYLGALRGLSEAGVDYGRVAAGVDWKPWREARF
jgi:uncharacterized membrane protein YccC